MIVGVDLMNFLNILTKNLMPILFFGLTAVLLVVFLDELLEAFTKGGGGGN